MHIQSAQRFALRLSRVYFNQHKHADCLKIEMYYQKFMVVYHLNDEGAKAQHAQLCAINVS